MSMEITRNMKLTIMPAHKTFQSNRLQRILGRSNSISGYFVKHMNNNEQILDKCEELFEHVFMRKRSCKAAGTMDSRNIEKYSRVSCNNKSNWKRRFGRQVYAAIHGDLSVVGVGP